MKKLNFEELVAKSRVKGNLIKLLEGRGKWRIVVSDMFGDAPGIPQDWDSIFDKGIYPIYQKGDTKIKEDVEKALCQMCEKDKDDEIYLVVLIWFYNLYKNKANRTNKAPFKLDEQLLTTKVKETIVVKKEKLLNCHKWTSKNDNLYIKVCQLGELFKKNYGIDFLPDGFEDAKC
ncbi:Immunity factor for SPN [Selenomonas ruminantium]|uniref:Immunity factor for SPN n=1 Tax=Selenomonas ruminantium TaxID=971 RepID=A0A1M6WVE4_SELRU|nr:NAD glycohydrolase toxin immunity factor [Selenomonas ruminantium]SHK97742.1 Immunity factor for SPN [Selenomonas ruminantium]